MKSAQLVCGNRWLSNLSWEPSLWNLSHPARAAHTGEMCTLVIPQVPKGSQPFKHLSSASMPDGLPWWLSGKESPCNAGDPGSIPGLGRSPGGGHGNPLQYSCLENAMDRGCHGRLQSMRSQSRTRLSELTVPFFFQVPYIGTRNTRFIRHCVCISAPIYETNTCRWGVLGTLRCQEHSPEVKSWFYHSLVGCPWARWWTSVGFSSAFYETEPHSG